MMSKRAFLQSRRRFPCTSQTLHHISGPCGSKKDMGKKSRRDGKQESPTEGVSGTDIKPTNGGRFAGPLAWIIVLALAFAYRAFTEAQVARREKPKETDIFVVSYPKSGNNWLRFLLAHTWLYSQPGEGNWHRELDFNSIEDTIPDLEYGPNRQDYHLHHTFRAFKSHQPYAPAAVPGKCADTVGTMEDFQCACPNCPPQWRRILHLVRDGRDVMCSYFHFRRGLGNLNPPSMSFEEFLKADIYPGFHWADHVASYIKLSTNASYDVLTVKYEDLHQKPFEIMVEIATWAGLDDREDVIRRAIAKSNFKSMRRKEELAGLRIFDKEYPHRDQGWRMTRKGQIGGWGECFATETSKDIWNEMAYDVMYKLGYVSNERW